MLCGGGWGHVVVVVGKRGGGGEVEEWWKRVVVTFAKDLQQKRLQKQETQEEKVGMETEDHRRL